MRAYLGLGSNLGDREAHLRAAVASLDEVVAVSGVYESDALGGPDGQERYLNAVVELETTRTPRALLLECQRLEQAAGRERVVRWGPRTLDVDVLLVGDLVVADDDLVVPHPRLWVRRFVLAPLAELAPSLVPAPVLAAAEGRVVRTGIDLGRGAPLPPA